MLAENEASIVDLAEDTPKKIDWNTKLHANLLEHSPDLDLTPDLELDLAMNTGGSGGGLDMPLQCGKGGKEGQGGST